VRISYEDWRAAGINTEVIEMAQWFNEFGAFDGASLSETQNAFPRLCTWEQYLRATQSGL